MQDNDSERQETKVVSPTIAKLNSLKQREKNSCGAQYAP